MPILGKKELRFLKANELCRLATVSADCFPHVTPVIYAMDGENIVVATDYGTKKLENLKANSKVSLVVDKYHPNKGITIQGVCVVHEKGKEYLRLLKILFAKFEYYRKNPWREGEAPILRIVPRKVTSWGLTK
jgi:PPOX class probable F420-dependent enzyme